MKKVLFLAMVAIAMSLMFVSCKVQNEPVINSVNNKVLLKAELAKIPNPSKEEMLKFLSGTAQKVKADDGGSSITLVEIFPLDSTTYQIDGDNLAMRYFWYSEIDQNGNLEKSLTIGQIFNIVDGKINETGYSFDVQISCPFSRYFYFENRGNISRITYFFRFDNGNQFAYFTNNGNTQVRIPPIANGKWQLKVDFYDSNIFQSFMSEYIDYYGSDVIKLKFGIKQENVLSKVFLDKSFIQNAYLIQFIGKDDNDNFISVSYPVKYDESLPDQISFNTPIKVLTRIWKIGRAHV